MRKPETDAEFLKRMKAKGDLRAFGECGWVQRVDIARLLALATRGAAIPDEPTFKPCEFIPWLGSDYGARCEVCGASKRGMMAADDLRHECKRAMLTTALKDTDNG